MPDTATQTLAEFLLARIAEDEDISREGEQWADTHIEAEMHARVLAECEAKRRIVGECEASIRNRATVAKQARSLGRAVLYCLAQPYADHDDFREEWRADA